MTVAGDVAADGGADLADARRRGGRVRPRCRPRSTWSASCYVGTQRVRVEDPAAAARDALDLVEAAGGSLAGQDERAGGEVSLTVRVPVDRFRPTLDDVAALGVELASAPSRPRVTDRSRRPAGPARQRPGQRRSPPGPVRRRGRRQPGGGDRDRAHRTGGRGRVARRAAPVARGPGRSVDPLHPVRRGGGSGRGRRARRRPGLRRRAAGRLGGDAGRRFGAGRRGRVPAARDPAPARRRDRVRRGASPSHPRTRAIGPGAP